MRRLLACAVTALLTLGAVAAGAGPASAAPPALSVTLLINIGEGTTDQPFVGQEVIAQTQSIAGPPSTAGWTCSMSFGDASPATGYWRAASYQASAPCAGVHTYPSAGDFTISVKVTDPAGASSTTTRRVHVTPRPVRALSGGVEGSRVTLPGPGAGSVRWTLRNPPSYGIVPRCAVADRTAADASLLCNADGTVRVEYDTGRAATSGAYDVTFVNGAPVPVASVQREGTPATRAGTGDVVTVAVDVHDPSTGGSADPPGDTITCVFAYGDGRTETVVSDPWQARQCAGRASYARAGTKQVTVTVFDENGATATRQLSVKVGRRDVSVAASGRVDGTSVAIRGALTPRGTTGGMVFRNLDGNRVVVRSLSLLEVTLDGTVKLQGAATLDGQPGYLATVWLYEDGRVQGYLDWVAPGATDQGVAQLRADPGELTVRLDAPSVDPGTRSGTDGKKRGKKGHRTHHRR